MIENAKRFRQDLINAGYIAEAPNAEVAQIDAEVTAGIPCPRCGRPMTYTALHKHIHGRCSYIALAACWRCNVAMEF